MAAAGNSLVLESPACHGGVINTQQARWWTSSWTACGVSEEWVVRANVDGWQRITTSYITLGRTKAVIDRTGPGTWGLPAKVA